MFLPTTRAELKKLGWDHLDVILVTGDGYVDSPFIGVSVIGKVLAGAGYRVGIIAQPDIHSERDIARLGKPALFWGVTGGCIDSMVANRTATKKPKRTDDLTPGGRNDRRPDRAAIVYANLIRRYFKDTVPIVLGGVEASLRRIAHYDYWDDSVRRSILFDAKADLLVYGMGEKTTLALAERLQAGDKVENLRGICTISKEKPPEYIELPSYESVKADRQAFTEMFHTFYRNNDPLTARGLCQQQDTRYLVQHPPSPYLSQQELNEVHGMDFERDVHPFYGQQGEVKALETIRFSITSHRGCYGECNFCSIAVHQGRTVRWRSERSILQEAERIARLPDFKGYIQDVGGPTANMYGFECQQKLTHGACADKRCLYPDICPQMKVDHGKQIALLRKLRRVEGVKKVFIGSGIHHDLVMGDEKRGKQYLREIVRHHVSGQMKIAPEHTEPHVLHRMGKAGRDTLLAFRDLFYKLTREAGKKQFLTYYLIAAHPGCTEHDMQALKRFASRKLRINPEQVQIFTPTPSTISSLMYYTEMDPYTGKRLFVEKDPIRKERQKEIVVRKKKR
jgi:uncharacterized radical SAM protein YgiQ